MSQDLNVIANASNEKPTKDETKYLGTKKHGTTIEVTIPAGSKSQYNPLVETIINTLPRHYALQEFYIQKTKHLI